MAKTASKRKSEGATPTKKSKLRKVATADDTSTEHHDESSDPLFIAEARHVKKPGRKSEPVRVMERNEDEGEEDRTPSQDFLTVYELQRKKRPLARMAAAQYMDDFTQRLEASGQALRKQLEELSTNMQKQDEQFLKRFSEAFKASRPATPPTEDASQKKDSPFAFGSLYVRSQDLTSAAKEIIEKFEATNQLTSGIDIECVLRNDWADEDEEMTKLLAIGCDVGIQRYEAALTSSAAPADNEDATEMAKLIYKDDEELLSNAWGKIAKKQERNAKRVLKSLAAKSV